MDSFDKWRGCIPKEYEMVTTTYVPCKHDTGFYYYVTFLCYKRKFIACELCHQLVPLTKWKFYL